MDERRPYEEPRVEEPGQQPRRRRALPSSYRVAQRGSFGVLTAFSAVSRGDYRARNDIDGYHVYVGVGAAPDLTGTPTFSATLPVNLATAPPVSGTKTYNLIVRAVNEFGLESQNQDVLSVTIDPSGNEVRHALAAPASLSVSVVTGRALHIISSYDGYLEDDDPATEWRVWVTAAPPNVAIDPYSYMKTVDGAYLGYTTSPVAVGTYYVTLVLYRQSDGAVSPEVQVEVEVTDDPDTPQAVASGFAV